MPNRNSISGLLHDLIDLIPVSDAAVGYWASEALDQLTQLRALAAERGFEQWNLANTPPFQDDPTVKPVLASAQEALQKLGELLDHGSIRKEADSESTGAASRIHGVLLDVQNHAAVH